MMPGNFVFTLFVTPLEVMYWIKWMISYTVIRIYNACHGKNRFDIYDVNAIGDPVKSGFVVPQLEKDMESPFPESHLQEASDEVLFYGVNSKSECLLVRVQRGSNQVADAWIYLKLANGKTYRLAESSGHQMPFEGKCSNFSCGKLQMHYLSPMRRWRIFYCGMLKETSVNKGDSEDVVFVKFVFLWKASSNIYDFSVKSKPSVFAKALARTEWKNPLFPPIHEFVEAMNMYAQSGALHGTVSVNDGNEYELYLFGERMRNLGKSANIVGCNFMNILGNTPGNGFSFHLGKASIPYICNNLSYGFVVQPDATLKAMNELDVSFHYNSNASIKSMNAIFNAGKKYEIHGSSIGDPIVLDSDNADFEASFAEFTVGKKKGYGLIISGKVHRRPKKTERCNIENSFPKTVPLTVCFSEEMSHFRGISGGKGSSLGILTKFSREEKTFTVPNGIIVTTSAYQEFLTNEILAAVKDLENVVYGKVEGNTKEACGKVSDVIVRSILPQTICHSIMEELKRLFGNDINHHTFAVRSSSTGEDTAAMSTAGQMDTFLGIQGVKKIFVCVKKCWASQFTQRAVEYKKRYGQILNSPMAVVIQEMVNCEVSGVLFTCDPVTNNPSVVTITANYGLGETVVSGSVEPDTIFLKKDANGILEVDSVVVGAKHQKVVMQESGGTASEDIPKDSRLRCCLNKELAKRLGNISLKIEKFFISSRDIEWGVSNGNVYILQSRPVANAAAETEFEIKHEMDAPTRCENDYFTVANTGEILPGAMSPLGLDLFMKCCSNVIQRGNSSQGVTNNFMSNKYFSSGLVVFYNHAMMDVVELIYLYGIDTPIAESLMISIFGRILDDPDLISIANEKMPTGKGRNISKRKRLFVFLNLFFPDWGIKKYKQNLEKYERNFLKHETAKETFLALMSICSDFDEALVLHFRSVAVSSIWNMLLFRILRDKKGLDNDVYGDFARLLATCSNVESANIPHAMQDVADQIVRDISCEQFKYMHVKDALKWLETSESEAGCKFRHFMKMHGHRCFNEYDVKSITWAMNPTSLVQLLQKLVGIVKSNKKEEKKDCSKIFSELHIQLGFLTKCMLKFILPNCRKGVRTREAAKSLYIKSLDYWRQAFNHLAKQMVSEGRIPDVEMIFFLSLDEVKDLLENRSPTILSRSFSRRKMFSIVDNYRFPEIMRGIPKPINEENHTTEVRGFPDHLITKGIPVSQGVTKGYVRVALTLEEASHLKQGEILVTYSTDVCWSPYFTIISGVVTELGGLISHGAVVAREYGLPCVVGLQNATKLFQTGDYVLLDGKKGILQRLPRPPSSEAVTVKNT